MVHIVDLAQTRCVVLLGILLGLSHPSKLVLLHE